MSDLTKSEDQEFTYTEQSNPWFSDYYKDDAIEHDPMSNLVNMVKHIPDQKQREKLILEYVENRIAQETTADQLLVEKKKPKVDEKLLKLLKDNFDAYRMTARKFPEKALEYAQKEMDKTSDEAKKNAFKQYLEYAKANNKD